MSLAAFEACLACGLRRGEVTAARLTVEIDRSEFELLLECTPSAPRAREIVESFQASRPPVREVLIETPHQSWRWRRGILEEVAGVSANGIRFVVSSEAPLPDLRRFAECWERCLATFRVTLVEEWRRAPRPPTLQTYNADDIVVLEGLAAVRRRPQMYIGPALDSHLLVEAIVHHAALGWLAGSTRTIEVELSDSGTISTRDDGFPFSFQGGPRGESSVEAAFGRVFGGPLERRGEGDTAREDFGTVWSCVPLAVATGLARELIVESSDGLRSQRQRFVRGRASPPEVSPPWQAPGNRITFTPDLNLLDVPLRMDRVRMFVERVASLCPDHVIVLNGERAVFESLRVAGRQTAMGTPAMNDLFLEHTWRKPGLVFRCSIGLSADAEGGLESVVNLSPPPPTPQRAIRGHHIDALLSAVVDAVGLPCSGKKAGERDLVGLVCLEIARPTIVHDEGGPFIQLGPPEIEAIKQSLAAPLSVFLDSIPESREVLAARWR